MNTQPKLVPETPSTLREKVRRVLLDTANLDHTMNIDEIAESLQLPRAKVAATIYNLGTSGKVVSSGTFKDKRYRWIGGEEQMKVRAQRVATEYTRPVLKHLAQIVSDLQSMVTEVNQQIKRIEFARAVELERMTKLMEENKALRAGMKEMAGRL